jgi:hypothetical protein
MNNNLQVQYNFWKYSEEKKYEHSYACPVQLCDQRNTAIIVLLASN